MGGGKFNLSQAASFILAIVALASQVMLPVLSFRVPIGAVASQKRLQEFSGTGVSLSGESYNLSYVPWLLDLAKVLGRVQPQPGFYLQNEPFSNYPGIDLRSLLLNQSSPLQLPEGLSTPDSGLKRGDKQGGPTLSYPPLQSPANAASQSAPAGDPGLPRLAVRPMATEAGPMQMPEPATQVASPDEITLSVSGHDLNAPPPVLTLDFQQLSSALTMRGNEEGQTAGTALASQPIIAVNASPFASSDRQANRGSGFMLWTLKSGPPDGNPLGGPPPPAGQRQPGEAQAEFQGTFVACMHGTRFQSLGRTLINLKEGRILVGSSGHDPAELTVVTPLASVRIKPGTAAIVEITSKPLLHVLAFEPNGNPEVVLTAGQNAVPSAGRNGPADRFQLASGEELILGRRSFVADRLHGHQAGTLLPVTDDLAATRMRVDVRELISKDILFDAANPEITAAQRACLLSLKERLLGQSPPAPSAKR